MGSSSPPILLLEAMASRPDSDRQFAQAWNSEERRDPIRIEQPRPVFYVEVYERSTRDAQRVSCLGRIGEFIRHLEQACSQ